MKRRTGANGECETSLVGGRHHKNAPHPHQRRQYHCHATHHRHLTHFGATVLCLIVTILFHHQINGQPTTHNEENTQLWSPGDTDPSDLILHNGHNNDNTGHSGHSRLSSLDVICGKEFMTVRAEFSTPFNGIVYSKSTYGQNKCVYVKPHSSLTHVTFNVRYDECGTKPDLQGKYFENTIVIQYGTDIIEALDEAKRLRCEWFEAYEKPATFRPAIPVADLDVIELNFQGDEIDCWMSIQEGKGPWSGEINRIVTVGQPLSLVVAINDNKGEFDMKVKSCFAHDGQKRPIYLIDEEGCILRPKMISPFKKIRSPQSGRASLISYAQFLAFKFPDSVDVQIQCTVEVCRHGCSSSCPHDQPMLAPSSRRQQQSNNAPQRQSQSQRQPSGLDPMEAMKKAINIASGFVIDNQDLLESASSDQKEITVSTPVPQQITTGDGSAILDHIAQSIRQIQNEESNKAAQPQEPLPIYEEPPMNAPPLQQQSQPQQTFRQKPQVPSFDAPRYEKPSVPKVHSPHGGNVFFQQQFPQAPQLSPMMASNEPIAQVMNIPLSPIYQHLPSPAAFSQHPPQGHQKQSASFPFLNPFNNFKLIKNNKNPSYLPQMITSYFNKNRRAQFVPNDNFQIYHPGGTPMGVIPGAKPFATVGRRRRFAGQQGEVGVKRGFQVVTSLDLNFAPNSSQSDQLPVYQGVPETIVYGVCLSSTHFIYLLAAALALLSTGAVSCMLVVCKLENSNSKKVIR